MDVIIILLVTLVLCMRNDVPEVIEEYATIDRETKLNPDYYVDENAFMEVANALGFGNHS